MEIKTKPKPEFIRDYRQRIGKRIREYREMRGFNQDELADLMEVNRSTISKIENGRFAISIDYLVKFAWYLDFELSLNDIIK
jgi:transcriptional regulator with XRE-family HTH domain